MEAFPLLLRRILGERLQRYDLRVVTPKNLHGKGQLDKKLESFLEYSAMESDCGGILVLRDADDDCPIELGKGLATRSQQRDIGYPVVIVCAKAEYESWFLASINTIKGNAGIPDTASLTGNAEDIANPKQWLTDWLPPGQAYKPTTHQASLSTHIDLNLAHANSRSFRRLCHAVEELVDAIDRHQVLVTPVP